jgi:hypothetical protein
MSVSVTSAGRRWLVGDKAPKDKAKQKKIGDKKKTGADKSAAKAPKK